MQDSAEPYVACPYCLTKITATPIEADNKPERVQVETILPKENPTGNKETTSACHYHLGYLSEHKQKERIPDECIVCKDIIECMFKETRM